MSNMLDEILKNGIDVLDIAKEIAPNGKVIGNDFTAICPFHSEKTPSYKIDIHKGISHCFGCGHAGDVVKDYAEIKGITLVEAKKEILEKFSSLTTINRAHTQKSDEEHLRRALNFWSTKTIQHHNLIFRYYTTRGLKHLKYDNIHFYTGTYGGFFNNNDQRPLNALVAKISDVEGNLKSLQIIELKEENNRIVRGQKYLFPKLPVKGYAIHLKEPVNGVLGLSEGLETGLSVQQALPNIPVWVALSSTLLLDVIIPAGIKTVFIFADNDNPGIENAKKLQKRLSQNGIETAIIAPKKKGTDFNDVLQEHGESAILKAFSNPIKVKESQSVNTKFSIQKEFKPRQITNVLKNKFKLFVDNKKHLWCYDENTGLWVKDADPLIERELRTTILAEEMAKKYYINEILEDVRGTLWQNKLFPENSNLHLIPFTNGVYDIKKDELLPYEPDMFLTTKIPVSYNPSATCPKIDKFFNQILPEQKEFLYQLAGYCFYRSYPYQQLFFLYGRGGNGKSQYSGLLTKLLGQYNVSSQTTSALTTNRFRLANLHNKLANICADNDYKTINNSDVLKTLTGGDTISAEEKNKPGFDFVNFAKLIFAVNILPQTSDKTDAFYRRIHLIQFNQKFEGKTATKNIGLKLAQDNKEMEGFTLRAVEALKGLIDNDFNNFIGFEETEKIAERYEQLSNPLETFLDNFTFPSNEKREFIPKTEFANVFNSWIGSRGLKPYSHKLITKEMKLSGYTDGIIKFYDTTKRIWNGLSWNPTAKFQLLDNEKGESDEDETIPF